MLNRDAVLPLCNAGRTVIFSSRTRQRTAAGWWTCWVALYENDGTEEYPIPGVERMPRAQERGRTYTMPLLAANELTLAVVKQHRTEKIRPSRRKRRAANAHYRGVYIGRCD